MHRRAWIKSAALSCLAGVAPKTLIAYAPSQEGGSLGVVALGGAGAHIVRSATFDPALRSEPVIVPSMTEMTSVLKRFDPRAAATRGWLIVAGLGGETGSTLAPVLAEWIVKSGVMAHAFVVWPFWFEGERRHGRARRAKIRLGRACQTVRVFRNESILDARGDASVEFETLLTYRTARAFGGYYRRLMAVGRGHPHAV